MYQQFSVGSEPVAITVTRGAKLQVLDQNVRMRPDGPPTASFGYQLAKDKTFTHLGEQETLFVVAETGTAEINVLLS